MPKRAWSTKELGALAALWPEYGTTWGGWADYLPDRTTRDISQHAYQLGLKRATGERTREEYVRPKPCPFCGAAPTVEYRGGSWTVRCNYAPCPVGVATTAKSHRAAIAHWNRRRTHE